MNVMIGTLLASIAGVIIAVISAAGYAGVALLMAVESACVPLPSEVIMPFAGYLASTGRFDLWLAALAGAVGCNLGSQIAYGIGARGGRPAALRYGRFLLLDAADIDRADRFFARFGGAAVLIARLLPVVRSFIAFPAGMARMPLLRFHLHTFVGSFIWCLALAWLGRELGARWQADPRLHAVMHRFDLAIVAALLALAGWWLWRKRRAA